MPNVLSPRDLVFRPDNRDETVPHTDFNYIENAFSKASVCAVWSFMVRQLENPGKTINLRRTNNAPMMRYDGKILLIAF